MVQSSGDPKVSNVMIAANANTVFEAISFCEKTNLVAYAAQNTVLILDPLNKEGETSLPKVLFSLNAHEARINSVQWICPGVLVSIGGDDHSLVFWKNQRVIQAQSTEEASNSGRDPASWNVLQHFKMPEESGKQKENTPISREIHTGTINYLSTYRYQQELYVTTICSDGVLKLWFASLDNLTEFKLTGELLFGRNLQETTAIHCIGRNHLMVMIGGYDSKVHVYTTKRGLSEGEPNQAFQYHFSLLGHMNSIKDIAISPILGQSSPEDTLAIPGTSIYIASGSQDQKIRIWKVQALTNVLSEDQEEEKLDEEEWFKKYQTKTSFVMTLPDEPLFNFTLESVIIHHSEAVSSCEWAVDKTGKLELKDLYMLSSSFDFTVCIWRADEHTEAWSVEGTLGAMVGNKHAFFGAIWLGSVRKILAYTYGGAMHQWEKDAETERWNSQLTIKGHFGAVRDLAWDQYSLSLVSTSADQTTRIFSEYSTAGNWYEVSRPQIHGYDMNTLAIVKNNHGLSSKILSGGDEKVLRLFEAPFNFIKTINALNPSILADQSKQLCFSTEMSNDEVESRIEGEAKKQPLGLMNKPAALVPATMTEESKTTQIDTTETDASTIRNKARVDDQEEGGAGAEFDPVTVLSNVNKTKEVIRVKEPPVEDILMARTLWPEQKKMYGHVFELFSLATTHQGDVAASACKSKEPKYAEIHIWDLTKNQISVPTCRLNAHKSTVIQLEFSKCDNFLLSCGKDRTWAIFERQKDNQFEYKLAKKLANAHTRIIWGISWAHDDSMFATASREKQNSVKFWQGVGSEDMGKQCGELPQNQNPDVNAIRFFPKLLKGKYAVVTGLSTGKISVWTQENQIWSRTLDIPLHLSHFSDIRRIKFRPGQDKNSESYTVATCADDHSVRIYKFDF